MAAEQPDLDLIQKAVENEILARLTGDPCETCGRGADADKIGATALSTLTTGLRRLQLAKQRGDKPADARHELNPLALVATVRKLPPGSEKRREMIAALEGQVISLQEAVDALAREEKQVASESEGV